MKYFIKYVTQSFYDGHGTSDDVELYKEIIFGCEYTTLKNGVYYIDSDRYCQYLDRCTFDIDNNSDDYPEFCAVPEDYAEVMDLYAEDGYNCTEEYYSFKEITKEEYEKYSKIIDEYNNL